MNTTVFVYSEKPKCKFCKNEMKAQDLRIGNIVQDEFGLIMYVYRLWKDGAELADDMDGHGDLDYDEGDIFGVPLTEELLVKASFKRVEDGGNWKHPDLIIFKLGLDLVYLNESTGEIGWYFDAEDDYYSTLKPLKYAHKLQNLYYELNDKELEFTL